MTANTDEYWMKMAIGAARRAADKGEVPIGAVAVFDGKAVAKAHNLREKTKNPLGHAEILLIQKLSKKFKSWRLNGVTIYVTCEPCLMCAGAFVQARVQKVVFGCRDPKAGAFGSLYNIAGDRRLNHGVKVVEGVLAKECAALLSDFFRKVRRG